MSFDNKLKKAWTNVHNHCTVQDVRPDEEVASFIHYLQRRSIPKGHFLDAGCGWGRNTIFLAQMGFTVIGCDLSSYAIETTFTRLARAGMAAGLQIADLRNLPYPADSFATAICVRVLPYHHKAEIIQCVHELRRVLEPGGYVYLNLLDCSDAEYGCGPELETNTFLDAGGMPIHFCSRQEVDELFSGFALEKAARQALTSGQNARVAWQVWARKPV